MNFNELNLSNQLMKAIKRLGFTEPTKIQKQAIPLILQGKDVIGESATGSGKTLAFGVGIIEKTKNHHGLNSLVLVPTRELAEQVKDDLIKLAHNKELRIIPIYGGVSINPQKNQLKTADVVIATPGRLLDHLNRRTIDLSQIHTLVLDEADRMVEMGFIEDVEKIIRACPKDRQTLLFSATMKGPAVKIAKKYMKAPEKVTAVKMVDPSKLKQTYYDVPSKLKKELLVHLLGEEDSELVMVFCNTRRNVDSVSKVLRLNKIKAAAIHGGLNQPKRLKTIDQFNNGKFNVLVCTDVAARGLDIQGVTHIYNYNIPRDPNDYVHRIGRTARAGEDGLVINLLSYPEYDNFSKISRNYREYHIEKRERPYLEPTIKHPPRKRNFRKHRNHKHRRKNRHSPRKKYSRRH